MSVIRKAVFIVVVLLLLFTSRSTMAQSGDISVGDTVEVVSDLNFRSGPGLSYTRIDLLAKGTQLAVVGGPREADGYTWWELEEANTRGWAAGEFLRVVSTSTSEPAEGAIEGTVCEKPYAGIELCRDNVKNVTTVLIDLDDPHIRFETILAHDTTSVNTGNREFVREMAEREDYNGLAAVINSDYFGDSIPVHGPEGLTVKNGVRLDGSARNDNDQCAVYRSALAISKSHLDSLFMNTKFRIIRLSDDYQALNSEDYYNVVGGGPQVIYDGVWKWERGSPNNPGVRCWSGVTNDVINGEYFRNSSGWDDRTWTAAGITKNNQMIWVIGLPSEVQSVFTVHQTTQAIKFDGGGSSQLWVAGREVVPSSDNRKVAEALGVFYLHSSEVISKPEYPVISEGEPFRVGLTVKNTGADTWFPGEVYLNSERNPFQSETKFSLEQPVKPGEIYTWEWTINSIEGWGIKTSEWQLMHQDAAFPDPKIKLQFVVIPIGLEEERENIEQKVRQWFEEGVEDIEQQIMDYLETLMQSWIERLVDRLTSWLENLISCQSVNLVLLSAMVISVVHRRRSIHHW